MAKLTPGSVDVHAHVVCPEVYATTSKLTLTLLPVRDPNLSDAQRAAILNKADEVVARMSEFEQRLTKMDAMGVERQLLSPSLVHQCTYTLPDHESLRLERTSNDWLAAKAASAPDRFLVLGTVPLQAPDLATVELRRCVEELGFLGVSISTFANGREVGDPALHGFWREVESLGAVVYVHPAGNRDPRFASFSLWNSVGQCFEESMAISSLMYEGVLERFPRLRICISHGGGYMPQNMGRIDRNWLEKPATRIHMTKPPLEYLKMLWFDSCVYDAVVLRHLAEKVGVSRVILGSDYPVGEIDPIGFVESSGLDREAADRIVRSNVHDWLGE
jgi:predicted TIM-barrel fold metal-dependent hydrolase